MRIWSLAPFFLLQVFLPGILRRCRPNMSSEQGYSLSKNLQCHLFMARGCGSHVGVTSTYITFKVSGSLCSGSSISKSNNISAGWTAAGWYPSIRLHLVSLAFLFPWSTVILWLPRCSMCGRLTRYIGLDRFRWDWWLLRLLQTLHVLLSITRSLWSMWSLMDHCEW